MQHFWCHHILYCNNTGIVCRYVLQSLVYPTGLSVDTLQANYSLVAGVGQVDTINRSAFLSIHNLRQ